MNPVETARRLIALASSKDKDGNYTPEAQNAALKACEIIRNADLQVIVSIPNHSDAPFPPEGQASERWQNVMRAVGVGSAADWPQSLVGP